MEAKTKCSNNAGAQHLAVVDDNPAIHSMVREQLDCSGRPWQMTAYHNGAAAIRGVTAALPQVVLMDIGMPEMTGIECANELKRRFPQLPVVMHTARAQPELVLSALRAGANGYVVKNPEPADLLSLLHKAVSGGLAMCPRAERLLMEAMQRSVAIPTEWGLTGREGEVLLCLCRHLSDKEMAAALGISEETVHVHLRRVFKKLDVHERQAAIRKLTTKWSGGG